MHPIEPPDTFALSACAGWLELGNAVEAEAEWEQLSPQARHHPLALEMRLSLLSQRHAWNDAWIVAEQLVTHSPEDCSFWLTRAYAIRRATGGGLQAAFEALHPASTKFPDDVTVAYNLACYTTQLGRTDEGWEWYLRSVQISKNSPDVKKMALADSDLEPLWSRIRGLR